MEKTEYKKPHRFGAQTLYDSVLLDEINTGHWEEFHKVSQTSTKEKKFTIADFIQNAVDLTAVQMVKFLREISALESIEEIREKANILISEISKEVDLNIKEKNTKKLEEFNQVKEETMPEISKETMENVMLECLCTAPKSQLEVHIKEYCIAFKNKGNYTAGELYDFIQDTINQYKHSWEMSDFIKNVCDLKGHYKRPE